MANTFTSCTLVCMIEGGHMDFIYEEKSPYSLEETITRLKERLPKEGFGILWELNFKHKLKEKGLSLKDDFWIFEVCNPAKAESVLNEMIQAGYFLPCKMAVYTREDAVYIGLPRPVELIGLITRDDLMRSFAEDVESSLTEVIQFVISDGL